MLGDSWEGFISVSSAPRVGYIITHITAQVLQPTKGENRFRTSLNTYFSLLYYSILSMNQEWTIYTKITFLFKSLNSCWVENMCQGSFLSCGRWKMMNTWFLKPRSSQSRGGDIHIHLSNPSQHHLFRLLQARSPLPKWLSTYTHTSIQVHILFYHSYFPFMSITQMDNFSKTETTS